MELTDEQQSEIDELKWRSEESLAEDIDLRIDEFKETVVDMREEISRSIVEVRTMNAHEAYKKAMQRIGAAQTPGESSDAASDGMDKLAAIYDATDNENTKAQCRRLIESLDMIDHEGDIEASERRACGILEG